MRTSSTRIAHHGPGQRAFTARMARAAVVGLVLALAIAAQPAARARAAQPSPSEGERRSSFAFTWQMVARNYLYADYHGVDWAAVRAEFEPQIIAAQDAATFYRLMEALVARLNDQHSRYLPPEQARASDAAAAGGLSYVGIGVQTVTRPEGLVIEHVFAGSAADEAGLRPREWIVGVNGRTWTPDCGAPCAISGPEGSRVWLTVRAPRGEAPGGEAREVEVERRRVLARLRGYALRLPQDERLGYLRIPTFHAWDMAEQVEAELRGLLTSGPLLGEPLAGLVIDVRGNGGGYRAVMARILGQFVSGEVGTFQTRRSATPLRIRAGALHDALAGVAVVVLIDHRTASAAEMLAGVLQQTGRARVVGERSAGNVESVYGYDLADGSRLLLARESFVLADGTSLEERGVEPDVEVAADWAAYAELEDPHVRQALALLREPLAHARSQG